MDDDGDPEGEIRDLTAFFKAKYPKGGLRSDENIPLGSVVPTLVSPVSQWPDEMVSDFTCSDYFFPLQL